MTELKKRILTSIILLVIALSLIFIHHYLFIAGLLIISYMAFYELIFLSLGIYKKDKKKILKCFYFNGVALFYLYVIFAGSCLAIYMHYGPQFFLFLLLISIFSDIGGYIFGRIIGGKKLTKISPNKTFSGSAGSFIFSLFPIIIFSIIYNEQDLYLTTNVIFCLLISLSTQIGDIFISFLKRKANLKDTGNILPGHGGILDRIDGIILALPFAYFLLAYYKFL